MLKLNSFLLVVLFSLQSYAAEKIICSTTVAPRAVIYGMAEIKGTNSNVKQEALNQALDNLLESLKKRPVNKGSGAPPPTQKTMEDCRSDAQKYSSLGAICDWIAGLPASNRQAALNTIQCSLGSQPFLTTTRPPIRGKGPIVEVDATSVGNR